MPTGPGVWAPTIRYRDGVFHVIVTVAMSPVGCVVFTATDPAGPWSDGTTIEDVNGIDPDLAWDNDGTAPPTSPSAVCNCPERTSAATWASSSGRSTSTQARHSNRRAHCGRVRG